MNHFSPLLPVVATTTHPRKKHADPDREAANSWTDPPASEKNPRLWGYEAPPVVETSNFFGWKRFASCDQCTLTCSCTCVQWGGGKGGCWP